MTKKYNVHITDNAQDDIEHIFFYIAEDNQVSAAKFVFQIEEKIYSLEMFPDRCPLIPENEYFNTNYRHLIYKKYRIIYRIDNMDIFILRIIHGSKLLYK